jgi:hypothetical protein
MSAYRGFVEKSTGKIIDLPNPGAYWGNDIHRQYYNFILKQGLPNPTKPGRPWYDWSGDWLDNSTAKFFESKAEAEKYSNSIKENAGIAEQNRIGINQNAKTPAEKLENYEKAASAYSSNIKNNSLNAIQESVYNKYKQQSIVSNPQNFTDAVNNYFVEFSEAKLRGVENISSEQKNKLSSYSRQLKDYYSKDLSPESAKLIQYVDDVQSAINSVDNQKQLVETQKGRVSSLRGKEQENARARLVIEEDSLSRLINTANQQAPEVINSLSRAVPSNIANIVAKTDERVGQVTSGLSALSSDRVFSTGDIAYKLNSQVTDQQIIDDINKARLGEYKKLYELGQLSTIDLQSRIKQAEEMLPSLSGQQKTVATKQIDDLRTQLTQVTKDTLQAESLYRNYTNISNEQAATAVSKFRESLRLPEQRTLDQIKEIDPQLFQTIQGLGRQYKELAETPIGATTAESTEALRRDTEGKIATQLALGSQLGAEEQRQYQQAARGAQAARGNIFGVAPAVEEAVTTGLAGEQRLQARLGAAQNFLSSGQSVSDALARDVGFRNALQLSRLGAASDFAAAGPTAYNMANARAAQQAAMISQYTNSALPQQTGGFNSTQSASIPYGYVDPQAGFRGAQTAANVYGSLLDYGARTYSAYTQAQAAVDTAYSTPNYLSAGASLLGGAANIGKVAAPGGFFCWVAREVYGADNPKWLQFREWMLTKASDNLRNFYIEYGERIAESIRNKPKIKSIIRKWMDSKIG